MVVEKSNEAVTQILTAKRQVMRKSPVYIRMQGIFIQG
jgi:hypothetical protein